MTNDDSTHWGVRVSQQLDHVVFLIFAIVLVGVVVVYMIYFLYICVTRNGTCSIKEGLKRSECFKNTQQLIVELNNKVVIKRK